MKFKYVNLPDGQSFDEKEIAFLQSFDAALVNAMEGKADKQIAEDLRTEMDAKMKALAAEQKFEVVQKQLDALFTKLDPMNRKPDKRDVKQETRKLTNQWIRALVQRKEDDMRSIEKKLIDEGGWQPGDGGDPLFPNGPVVMHGAPGFDPEQGAYLVPELLLAEVYRWIYEAGIARRDMRYLPFSGPGNERTIPTLLQSVIVGWVDQGGMKPKTKPYVGKVIQRLEKLAAICVMTEEIVEDSAIDLISFVGQLFGEAIAIEEDRVFFAGNLLAGDPFNGVINAAGVVPIPMPANLSQAVQALNIGIYSIPTPARAGAKFYMNPAVYAMLQVARQDLLAEGDGLGPFIVQHPVEGGPATMWGYPIVLTDELPGMVDNLNPGDPFMFFANLQKTCVYGDKLGLRVKMLTEASITDAQGDKINLAEHDLLAIRVHKRVGYVPVLPNGIAVFHVPLAP